MSVKKEGLLYELHKNKVLFIMILPAVGFFILFSYIPLGGLIIAFKNYNYADGIFLSPWAGLDNFKFFFLSGKAWLITKNTISYNVTFLAINTAFEIVLAIFISEMAGRFFKKAGQTLMFLPYFISWVIVSAFVYNIFNYEYGLINGILKSIGAAPVDIYGNPGAWRFILPMFSAWKTVGYGSIIYLAAIMGIDAECYEAADIDGANIFQKIWHITLPLLIPTAVILILLKVGRILRGDFEMFYQLIGDASNLYEATDVIDTFVFRSLFNLSDLGMASAAGFYQSVVCFITITVVNGIIKKVHKDYALY